MCGFTGFLWPRHVLGAGGLAATVERMAQRLAHRGPDDAGSWVDEQLGLALGHRRLAILELSPAGRQPMASACARFVLAYNGEIYNHLEMRAELAAVGWNSAWRGHSDTETLLAAISHWGLQDALARAVGMFAFALWDREQRRLHLVRDRLGEKPLYYGWQGGAFLFGSELKALAAHPAWVGDVDREALSLFLRHNQVPGPFSIYQGIAKLPPGCLLSLDCEAGGPPGRLPAPLAYWTAQAAAENGHAQPFAGDKSEAADELERLLRRSVRGQMLADVPLGAFLSGGIDSSTVVALMQAQSERPVRTYTIGFHEPGYDEAEHARAVAKRLGTEHTEWYVTAREAMDVIPALPRVYDEPFSDSSQIPTLLISRLTRAQVTVALSGDGGDELFGGYERYFWGLSLWSRCAAIPRFARLGLGHAAKAFPQSSWDRAYALMEPLLPKSKRFARPGYKIHRAADLALAASPAQLYRELISHWKDPASLVLGGREPAPALAALDEAARRWGMADMMMLQDTQGYLPDDILVKVDRAAMSAGLETRAPFLDHRLLEFAWRLPLSMKLGGGVGKRILRQVLYRHLPQELMERPKMGFGVPLGAWLRGPLRDWAEHLLDPVRLAQQGYLRPEPIRALWTAHLRGQAEAHYYLWDVLMFQAWLENRHAN
jgi:asparagine synthase (glutamine-hydrolysing)